MTRVVKNKAYLKNNNKKEEYESEKTNCVRDRPSGVLFQAPERVSSLLWLE